MRALHCELPEGVTAQLRCGGGRKFIFLMNFSEAEKIVDIPGFLYKDLLTGEMYNDRISLLPYGVKVMEEDG